MNLLGTLRARVGWASNDWLFYGSGGFAYGNVRSTLNLDDPADALSFAGSKTETRAGWAAGGGIGYAIMPNWIIGVDYLHYDLGRANVTAFGAVIDPASGFVFSAGSLTASQSVAGDIVRGVINYKL